MWELAGIVVTSLNMGFVDLPDTAYSYDGKERDISKFYEQTIPTTQIGGYTILDDKNWIEGSISTGLYTRKMDVYPTINATWNHLMPINNNWSVTTQIGAKIDLGTTHRPCTDSYDRKYYCGNLTAWSDFKQKDEINVEPKIGITFTRSW